VSAPTFEDVCVFSISHFYGCRLILLWFFFFGGNWSLLSHLNHSNQPLICFLDEQWYWALFSCDYGPFTYSLRKVSCHEATSFVIRMFTFLSCRLLNILYWKIWDFLCDPAPRFGCFAMMGWLGSLFSCFGYGCSAGGGWSPQRLKAWAVFIHLEVLEAYTMTSTQKMSDIYLPGLSRKALFLSLSRGGRATWTWGSK
jgi:hypothetical protein